MSSYIFLRGGSARYSGTGAIFGIGFGFSRGKFGFIALLPNADDRLHGILVSRPATPNMSEKPAACYEARGITEMNG